MKIQSANIQGNEKGYLLLGVLFILSLSMMVTVGLMSAAASQAKIRTTVVTQSKNYYEVEATLSKVVAWMQANSKSLVTAFTAANFSSNFDLGSPVVGDNEGSDFSVPTMVKMKGTNDSVILSNNDFFGTSAFPATTHIDTGAAFDAISEFQAADFGAANARVILVWAQATDGNYQPIFRLDVITGNNPDRGVHSFSYIYSNIQVTSAASSGFYGEDSFSTQTSNNQCASYKFTYASGAWSKGAQRSSCVVASDYNVTLRSRIMGDALSLSDPGVVVSGPSGQVTGTVCEGLGCHAFTRSVFNTWATECATNQGDLTITSNTTLTPSGSAPAQNCWRDITVNAGKTLTFDSTTYEYHIRKLDIKGSGNIVFPTVPEGQKVTIYVEEIVGDKINGNMLVNTNNAPHNLEINYTGTNAVTFNGTASMHVLFDAPYADVDLNGNFNFYGGVKAKNLNVLGNSVFYQDEDSAAASPVLSDMTFSLRKASQRYRL